MCRLAFFPSGTRLELDKLTDFLECLEKSFGGDGNGFAAISPKNTLTIKKAVGLSCKEIAEEIHDLMQLDWAVYFHTRKTSIGFTVDEQCHPFRIKGPKWNGSLCHNGTWNDGGTIAKYLGVGSDTAAFAYMIGELGLEEIEKRKLMPRSGVFMLYGSPPGEHPQHSVLNIGGSLEYCPDTKIWASEFPRSWDGWAKTYNVKTGVHSLLKEPERGYKYTNTNYYGNEYNNRYGSYTSSVSKTNSTTKVVDSQDDKELEDLWDGESMVMSNETDEKLWGDRYWYHTSM